MSGYWDRVSAAYTHDDAATQRKAELGFVQRTGVLPDTLKRKYQGALLSSDPAVAVSGAEAITKLAAMDPALVADIPVDHQQRANTIARYADLDLPPDRAVQLAEIDVEKGDAAPASTAADTAAHIAVDERPVGSSTGETSPELAGQDAPSAGNPVKTASDVNDTEDTRAGAGIDVAGGSSTSGQDINWSAVERLQRVLETKGDEAFTNAARESGLDPDRVKLFLAVLVAKPEDVRGLRQQINKSYGAGYGLGFWLTVQNILRGDDGPEARKQYLTSRLWELRRDAPHVEEGVTDILSSAMAPVFGPGRGRRSKPGGPARQSRANLQPARLEPGPGYRPDRNFFTPEEYRKLPDKGFIDPQRVRTSQDSFSNRFKEEYVEGRGHVRRTVDELAAQAKAGNDKDVPPIRLVEWKGFVYSPDHRRLVAYRRAGKDIQYEKYSYGELNEDAQKRIRKASKINDNGSFIRSRDTNLME